MTVAAAKFSSSAYGSRRAPRAADVEVATLEREESEAPPSSRRGPLSDALAGRDHAAVMRAAALYVGTSAYDWARGE